jgi:hypothetical protein
MTNPDWNVQVKSVTAVAMLAVPIPVPTIALSRLPGNCWRLAAGRIP